MKVHEYQAKTILTAYGIPAPKGEVARTPEEVAAIAQRLGGRVVYGARISLEVAFISTGLWPPAELNAVPRTIFDDDKTKHFYDQLAWFSNPDGTSLLQGLAYGQRAGTFVSFRTSFRMATFFSFRLSCANVAAT